MYIKQGWNQLLGPEGRQAEVLDFAKLFLILLLALSTLGTIEKTSSVELLIRPSAKGSNAVNRVKFKLCTAYAFRCGGNCICMETAANCRLLFVVWN